MSAKILLSSYKHLHILKGEIKELKDIIQTQNETIMAALSAQKVVTESLVRQEKNNVAIKNVFPINTLEELKALNDVIIDENKQIYVSYFFLYFYHFRKFCTFLQTNAMKLSLKGKLPKTLTTILSLELILAINIDGTHGKKRLKDFEKVFDALMDAVRPLCDDPDKELRNALAVIKKRHFHNVCVEKKN